MAYNENLVMPKVGALQSNMKGPLSSIEYDKDAERVVMSAHAFLELVEMLESAGSVHENHIDCAECGEFIDDEVAYEVALQIARAKHEQLKRVVPDVEETLRSFGAAVIDKLEGDIDLDLAVRFAVKELQSKWKIS